jgi:excisionase family DNA binding protein
VLVTDGQLVAMTVTQTIWTPTSGTPTRVPMRAEPRQRAAASAPPASETLMTIKDVADACKLSETAIRRAVSEGELPAVKLRSRLRITPQAFDAWITAQRQPTTRLPTPPRAGRLATRPATRRTPAPGTFRAQIHADADRKGRAL